MNYYANILTIAGSDSGGGAGIQADLKAITAHKCYGASVVTAITAQNTVGVQGVHGVPPDFVRQQINSVLSDIEIDAIKTGMLLDGGIVNMVATALNEHFAGKEMHPFVCDPVCVSTSGHTLLHPEAIHAMTTKIFPLCTIITPNKSEAILLLKACGLGLDDVETLENMVSAAKRLILLGSKAVLLKGGHFITTLTEVDDYLRDHPEIKVVRDGLLGPNMEVLLSTGAYTSSDPKLVLDVLYEHDETTTFFVRPRLDTTSTHGTGCTLASSIACHLGRGKTINEAVREATLYTHHAIATAHPIGSGHGPLNHVHSLLTRTVPIATPTNPHPFVHSLISKSGSLWREYVEHDFVRMLGKGTLPKENFIHFIKQDYHYLKYHSQAHGLLATKSSRFSDIQAAAEIITHIVHESTMHVQFCELWGISKAELERTPESSATIAYGAYIVNMGLTGDYYQLLMALIACLLGYGEVGLWLKREAARENSWVKLDGNPYKKWIDDYSGEGFQAAVRRGIEKIEAVANEQNPSLEMLKTWTNIWEKTVELERRFWDMAMELQ